MADRLKQRLDLISNGSSTPNAAVSSSNSTPIQKQFEISSENVSKITRPSVDNSHQEDEEEHSAIVADNSTAVDEKEAVASTSAAVAAKEPEPKKDAPVTSKDFIGAEHRREDQPVRQQRPQIQRNLLHPRPQRQPPPPTSLTPPRSSEDALYEVSVWFDGAELQFLSVEKVIENKMAAPGLARSTHDLTGIDSSKQFSNGSVLSLGPFQLPSERPVADSHSSATDSSETISNQSKAPLSKVKHTVRGAKALASLMIEEFTKITRALSKDNELSDAELDQSSSNAKTPKTTTKKGGRGQKRTRTKSEAEEDSKTIVGHAVHALTYEAGFVDEVKRNETTNEVSYVVRIGEGTVEVTASDLYLNEEQAKYINRACKAAEGGVGRSDAVTVGQRQAGQRDKHADSADAGRSDRRGWWRKGFAVDAEQTQQQNPVPRHRPIKTTGALTYTPARGQTSSQSPAANAPISNATHILPTTSFFRQWFVCFPASPFFGNSSAFRKVTLPALVCASQPWPAFRRVALPVVDRARPSSSPRFRNSTVFRRAVLTAVAYFSM
ncbi:hypothetical protein pipiens_003552 [Culex pipiens pipiens]|uniref:Uncharacterized protein n=1 Tax=Culex pipiens pipiens TaxID=38569 RepID=A0ABD1CW40_CULPP